MRPRHRVRKSVIAAGAALALSAGLCACAGAGGTGGGKDSINVLMVNNPQMIDIQKLTADNFTKQTGIKVNYTVLPENDVRDKISQELSSQAGIYDISTISNYEVPFYAKAGWLAPLSDYVANDAGFDQADIFPGMTKSLTASDGKLYAEPFYGESSFLMYRKDVFAAKGLTMPAKPTWQQVADLAAKVDNAQPGMRGICLRGQVGWGADLRAADHRGEHLRRHLVRQGLEGPGQQPGVQRRGQLLRQPGAGARRGRRSAGRLHRVPEQPRAGQGGDVVRRHLGRRLAGGRGLAGGRQDRLRAGPGGQDRELGLALRLVLGDRAGQQEAGRGLEVHLLGLGKEYENLVGSKLGWTSVPAGKRQSTYDNPEYVAASRPSPQPTRPPIQAADPANPGVQPRPVARHPVHGLPGVQRPGDHGVAVRQHRDSRPDQRGEAPSGEGQKVATPRDQDLRSK